MSRWTVRDRYGNEIYMTRDMSELSLHETEFITRDGQRMHLAYEEVGDILEIQEVSICQH